MGNYDFYGAGVDLDDDTKNIICKVGTHDQLSTNLSSGLNTDVGGRKPW